MTLTTAQDALARLEALADPQRAAQSQRYFKAERGGYADGDRFLGVRVPDVRAVARQCALPLAELERLFQSPWHEARLLAVLLYAHAARARPRPGEDVEARRRALYESYLRLVHLGPNGGARMNWDLVDTSAEHVVGLYLADKDRSPLRALAASSDVWERRIAVLATLHFLRRGEVQDTLGLAVQLLHDPHDLLHKAVGWMLREMGQRCGGDHLRRFLDQYGPAMPRTALRYAIEHLPDAERRHYLSMPRRPERP